ncbi:MAG: UDP-N-acetylmuramate--L-alanine ligase [Capsulimonadaceae bacterium]
MEPELGVAVGSSERIHFIGIGGAGMSGLARILARQGVHVTGSDQRDSETLEALRQEHGIDAAVGHAAENIAGATTVVYSAAVKEDNPEIVAAHDRGIPVISRAAMLGKLMEGYERSIAVSGTHGKTTTTAMIAAVLDAGGLDPTVLVGGDVPAFGGNAHLGASDVFVAEACEAYNSFLSLRPWMSVITNIEADHLDYYGDFEHILRSFRQFLSQTRGKAIVGRPDAGIDALLADPERFLPVVDYGSGPLALQSAEIDLDGLHPSYTAIHHGERLGRICLSVPGAHNVNNSLAAVAVGLEMGVPFDRIAAGLASFTGTGRRFERLGETPNGVLVVDDYAHHPTEIRATLAAARRAFGRRRIVAVFQPHLPSRTADFLDEFADSFGDADQVVLTEIYLARESPREDVDGALLAGLTARRRGAGMVEFVADKCGVVSRLATIAHPGDVVLTLGAGHDVRMIAEEFLSAVSLSDVRN